MMSQERGELFVLRRAVRRHHVHNHLTSQTHVFHVQPRLSVRPADGYRYPGVLSTARVGREGLVECHCSTGDDRLSAAHR